LNNQELRRKKKQMNFGKSIRRFRKNTRAISPVIATLLMIAIAVVASLVTYAWVMGYMNFQTAKTGKAIQIQSISYAGGATDTFTVYVQNVGDSPLALNNANSVFINGVAASGTWTDLTLDKGETVSMPATITGLTNGVQSITIKAITVDGTFSQVTQQFTIT
jgi:archaeal type IV pilus assembly protein PilA